MSETTRTIVGVLLALITLPLLLMASIISEIKWYMVTTKRGKCPRCGSRLVERGYPKDFYQAYKCPMCGWGEEERGG